MRLICLPIFLLLVAGDALVAAAPAWSLLPPLPDKEGFAGAFAGTSGGTLLVAGGSNFPGKKPWEGGTKVWYDTVFALDNPQGGWKRAGRLPQPNAYGVSISCGDGLICIGGGNASANFRDVFRLRYSKGNLEVDPLPPLPERCAFMAGAAIGNTLYVAGGIDSPAATRAMHHLWALDLDAAGKGWQSLPPWPGPERILACTGVADGSLFLFSGARLFAGPDGKAARKWLRDSYRFTPGTGWRQVADLPRPAVASPSPAPLMEGSRLWVVGGDDGVHVEFEPKDKHPGFPRDVLAYDIGRDAWSVAGTAPFSLVTTTAVLWRDHVVIPGGEARPGKRSPEVWRVPLDR